MTNHEDRKQDSRVVFRAITQSIVKGGSKNLLCVVMNDISTVGEKVVAFLRINKCLLQNKMQEFCREKSNPTTAFFVTKFLLWKRNLNGIDVTVSNHCYRISNFKNFTNISHELSRSVICGDIDSVCEEVKYT